MALRVNVLPRLKRYVKALQKSTDESEIALGNLYMDYEDKNSFYYREMMKIIDFMMAQQRMMNNTMIVRLNQLSELIDNDIYENLDRKSNLTNKISTKELKL